MSELLSLVGPLAILIYEVRLAGGGGGGGIRGANIVYIVVA